MTRIAAGLLIICTGCVAQDTLTLTGPVKVRAGTAQTLTLTFTTLASGAAGLEWTAVFPSGFTATPMIGPAAVAAGKTLTCDSAGVCLLTGLNTNTIGPGVVAIYAIAIPLGTAGRVIQIPLTGCLGASPLGSAVAVESGPVYQFTIYKKAARAAGNTAVSAPVVVTVK